jgi:hypothetical protein
MAIPFRKGGIEMCRLGILARWLLIFAVVPAFPATVSVQFQDFGAILGDLNSQTLTDFFSFPGFESTGAFGVLRAVRISSSGGSFVDMSATNDTTEFQSGFAFHAENYSIGTMPSFFNLGEGTSLALEPGESGDSASGSNRSGFAEYTQPSQLVLFLVPDVVVQRTWEIDIGTVGLSNVYVTLDFGMNASIEYDYNPVPTPEPTSFLFAGLGLLAILGCAGFRASAWARRR